MFTTTVIDVTVTFVNIDINNKDNCSDTISVSSFGDICDDSMENINIVLNNTKHIEISFNSNGEGEGQGFLMFVEKASRKYFFRKYIRQMICVRGKEKFSSAISNQQNIHVGLCVYLIGYFTVC